MRIRPYIENKDYEYLEKWIDSERTHALWCANLIPYPLTKESLHDFLERCASEWMDSAYVATKDNGEAIGFFCYSINTDDNTGFLKFVVVDSQRRGAGQGTEMEQMPYVRCVQTIIGLSQQPNYFIQSVYFGVQKLL